MCNFHFYYTQHVYNIIQVINCQYENIYFSVPCPKLHEIAHLSNQTVLPHFVSKTIVVARPGAEVLGIKKNTLKSAHRIVTCQQSL